VAGREYLRGGMVPHHGSSPNLHTIEKRAVQR
jgi:hypothetical protein